MKLELFRLLDVRVRLSAGVADGYRWRWEVLESDGQLIETDSLCYDTEVAALKAGNAAARAIRKRALLPLIR
jgi:hypothetical protein